MPRLPGERGERRMQSGRRGKRWSGANGRIRGQDEKAARGSYRQRFRKDKSKAKSKLTCIQLFGPGQAPQLHNPIIPASWDHSPAVCVRRTTSCCVDKRLLSLNADTVLLHLGIGRRIVWPGDSPNAARPVGARACSPVALPIDRNHQGRKRLEAADYA
jgi:hypothetical protein